MKESEREGGREGEGVRVCVGVVLAACCLSRISTSRSLFVIALRSFSSRSIVLCA